jgi:hypothetical protein
MFNLWFECFHDASGQQRRQCVCKYITEPRDPTSDERTSWSNWTCSRTCGLTALVISPNFSTYIAAINLTSLGLKE